MRPDEWLTPRAHAPLRHQSLVLSKAQAALRPASAYSQQ
jgi:hypothetical protein